MVKHWRNCSRDLLYSYLSSKQITHFELQYVLGNLVALIVTGKLTLSFILPFSGYFRLRLLVQVRQHRLWYPPLGPAPSSVLEDCEQLMSFLISAAFLNKSTPKQIDRSLV